MAIKKMEHVGVMVGEMARSLAFYTEVLGMKHLHTIRIPDSPVELAFLAYPDAEETAIELVAGVGGERPAEGKVHHIAFTVDDLEGEIERIKKLNVPLRDTDITTLPDGGRYFFFFGPDGELLELFQPAAAR